MRVGALSCVCARVCDVSATVAAELQAGLAPVSSRSGSSGFAFWGRELGMVPEGSFLQVCAGCGYHCVCETEDGRQVPEAPVCVSWSVLHPNVGPWPGDGMSACRCKDAFDSASDELLLGSYRHSPPPHCASAPFWAPYSLCAQACPACVWLTVRLCSLGPWVRSSSWACGRAEPGPLGPSRRRWLRSARFPGSGFPLMPRCRSGLPPPHPPPRNVPLHSSRPSQGQAPGGRHSSASPPREPRRGRCGQDAWVPPPSHPREKFLRGPLRLWVPKNNPAGEGRLWREGSGRGAEPSCGVLQVPLGRGREERRAYGGWGTNQPPESWLVLIPGESLGPPATPREGRKPLGGSVSQLVGCTILGQTV